MPLASNAEFTNVLLNIYKEVFNNQIYTLCYNSTAFNHENHIAAGYLINSFLTFKMPPPSLQPQNNLPAACFNILKPLTFDSGRKIFIETIEPNADPYYQLPKTSTADRRKFVFET